MIDRKFPKPDYPKSKLIVGVKPDYRRCHKGNGDMWPITWSDDDHLYGGAGDNQHSPMNFWRIEGDPNGQWGGGWGVQAFEVNPLPVNHKRYCQIPPCDENAGIKPAGLLCYKKKLYMAVEGMNYGENPKFNRQRNVHGWIVTSDDYGKKWNVKATPTDFFTDRLSSCHFLQFGKNYAKARDNYVYAYFPAADDGNSYWENGDYMLLGRVDKNKILNRQAWKFCCGIDKKNQPTWHTDEEKAVQIFRYPLMTGENHVSYNAGLKRYILGNYSFVNKRGRPYPYHSGGWERSQLTLFEAPEPWGPWSLFYRDDDWGTYGDYQPNFPTKWMSKDGKILWIVSSGTHDDYNFTYQKFTLKTKNV